MLSRAVAVLVSVGFLSGAVAAAQPPPAPDGAEFRAGVLVKRGDRFVLTHLVTNVATREDLWVVVEVNDPDGGRLCESTKHIRPKASFRYECPLPAPAAGQQYQARLHVYFDDELTIRGIRYEPVFEVTAERLAAAGPSAGENADNAPAVADGVDEAKPSPPVPITFKPTWYRRLEKGFSLRAYEDSGDLTVSADGLLFAAGKRTIRIPFDRIASVRLEMLPRDIANHWVVIRFTNDEQQPATIGFRDGGRMGGRGGTGKIYLALHRAARR